MPNPTTDRGLVGTHWRAYKVVIDARDAEKRRANWVRLQRDLNEVKANKIDAEFYRSTLVVEDDGLKRLTKTYTCW